MPPAILYPLAQTRIADLHAQARRDAPARARRTRTPTPGHRDRRLPAVVARRVLAALGGGSHDRHTATQARATAGPGACHADPHTPPRDQAPARWPLAYRNPQDRRSP
jgi:hypothetical protein